jgi:hypothetical protein
MNDNEKQIAILKQMEELRQRMAELARDLPMQDRTGMGFLHDDIYRLKGRFMQVGVSGAWQF